MERFEKQLRELPWRKQPDHLRERIFGGAPETDVPKESRLIKFIRLPRLAWAAVVILSAGWGAFMAYRKTTPAVELPLWVYVDAHTTGADQHQQSFFDLSPQVEASWSGELKLTIESN